MEGPEVGENQSIEKKSSPKPARRGKKILLLSIVLIVLVAVGVGIWLIVRYGVPKAKETRPYIPRVGSTNHRWSS